MPQSPNVILASLIATDAAALKSHLKPVRLTEKRIIYEAGAPIETIYFPLTATVSVVVGLSTGKMIEVATIGKDGIVGACAALGNATSLSRMIVQIGGDFITCDARRFRNVAMNSHALLALLFRHEQALFAQAQQSAACISEHQVEARLARWLLRTRDLAGTDLLHFTQEGLADMLGVRRTSVTSVARALQKAGMIEYVRGKIRILNEAALKDTSCECYETVKMHNTLLMASKNALI